MGGDSFYGGMSMGGGRMVMGGGGMGRRSMDDGYYGSGGGMMGGGGGYADDYEGQSSRFLPCIPRAGELITCFFPGRMVLRGPDPYDRSYSRGGGQFFSIISSACPRGCFAD